MNKLLIRNIVVITSFLAFTPAFARAGGGSNGGGGGLIQLILLPFILIYSAYVTHRLKKKAAECKNLLSQVQSRESGWDIQTIEGIATRLFHKIQDAWCDQDTATLVELTKGSARSQLVSELEKLTKQGHKNRMDDLAIAEISLLNIQNFLNDEEDNFTVSITASARDYTVDSKGAVVSANTRKKGRFRTPESVPKEQFSEFWTFEREGEDWVLLELAQGHAWKSIVERPLVDEGTAPDSPYSLVAGTGVPAWRPAAS